MAAGKRGRPPKNQQINIAPTPLEPEEEEVNGGDEPVELTKRQQEVFDYYEKVKRVSEDNFQILPTTSNSVECVMCRRNRPHNDFYRSYSLTSLGNMLPSGERHHTVCRRCAKKIFYYYYEQVDRDLQQAMNHWCQTMDFYYSNEVFEAFLKLHDSRKGTEVEYKFDYVTDYVTALGRARLLGLTYWDSPYLKDTVKHSIKIDVSAYIKEDDPIYEKEYPEEFDDWSQEDLDNYDAIMSIYKYDPFIDEPTEDRRKLYYNLVGFSSEDIAEDAGKANACIDMCRSIQRLEKLNKMRITMEHSDQIEIKDLKTLSELQEKERSAIQKYQKEWGFNQRYSLNKNRGAGTLTGILKQMDDEMFEDALVNAYDIKTSNAMQMAADASWKAIFGQLNISESEFSEIVKNQRETIMNLRASLDDTKEELRKANLALKRHELEMKLAAEQEAGDFK